jgi:predicted Zn-dependent protease
VLAHETAHIQKNHFFQDQKKIMAMQLATIAAILLGGPEAAVLAAGANLNLQLSYSREHEEEADAAGLIYLRRAGYNPEGLLKFFETLASYERFNPPLLPSYFSTHPGVQDRLRTVAALLRGHHENPSSVQSTTEVEDWQRTAIVLRSISGGAERSAEDLRRMVEKVVGENAPEHRRHYLLGLAYLKIDRVAQAIPEYQEALNLNPGNAVYHADLAYCYLRSQKINLAQQEARKAADLSQKNFLPYLILGIVQAEAGDLDGAISFYQQALSITEDEPQIHWNLAQAYFKKENKLMGTYHLARYSRLNLEPDKAMGQFKRAQELAEKGSELSLRIQKEIDEIQQEGI